MAGGVWDFAGFGMVVDEQKLTRSSEGENEIDEIELVRNGLRMRRNECETVDTSTENPVRE